MTSRHIDIRQEDWTRPGHDPGPCLRAPRDSPGGISADRACQEAPPPPPPGGPDTTHKMTPGPHRSRPPSSEPRNVSSSSAGWILFDLNDTVSLSIKLSKYFFKTHHLYFELFLVRLIFYILYILLPLEVWARPRMWCKISLWILWLIWLISMSPRITLCSDWQVTSDEWWEHASRISSPRGPGQSWSSWVGPPPESLVTCVTWSWNTRAWVNQRNSL